MTLNDEGKKKIRNKRKIPVVTNSVQIILNILVNPKDNNYQDEGRKKTVIIYLQLKYPST